MYMAVVGEVRPAVSDVFDSLAVVAMWLGLMQYRQWMGFRWIMIVTFGILGMISRQ